MSYMPHFMTIGHNAELVNKLILIEEGIKTHEIPQHLMYMNTYTKQNKIMKTWLNAEFFFSPVFDTLCQEQQFSTFKDKGI